MRGTEYIIDYSLLKKKGSFIDWIGSVGCKIPFIYRTNIKEIRGELEILNYIYEGHIVTVKFEDVITNIRTSSIKRGTIGNCLGEYSDSNFIFN